MYFVGKFNVGDYVLTMTRDEISIVSTVLRGWLYDNGARLQREAPSTYFDMQAMQSAMERILSKKGGN